MRYLSMGLLFLSFGALSETSSSFNQALREDLVKEIKKDEFKYKKKSFRAPASVEEKSSGKLIGPPSKVDKVRQIGPSQW